MKIFYCIPGMWNSGGTERVCANKANYFSEKFNYDIYIITTEGKNKGSFYKLNEKVKLLELDINYLEYNKKNFFFRKFFYHIKRKKYIEKLKKILKDNKPDILVTTGGYEGHFISKLKENKMKIIGEFHFSKYYRKLSLKKIKLIDRIRLFKNKLREEMIVKKCDEFIILTEEDRKQWNNPRIKVIPNSLSFYPSEVSKCENKKIISVGRLKYQKGYDILIEVWKKVFEKHKDWILEIYGEGSLRKELEEKIKKLGLENSLLLKGAVNNIQEKYLESSIYVMTSRYEGFGMVLVEAMACGLPLVSFDCPCGPKDVITDKEDGYICKFGNIEEMAKKICDLIENEEKRKEFGKKARENSLRYEESKIMNQWKNLFENLIEK